ncbi:uncharacterized protein LOC111487777 [Cucurbita maxima]|uniref:Uncharacterized protein LOC111487777 n=1 Tax=Cucurbita maxima TaxID=3661 RepID=A0A6J1JKP1_CUCMA|nr:uncharacterized protein LOC111487777 [Cucurbita maxima]
MQTRNDDQISQKSLKIKHEDNRLLSRALSKEANSAANSSFRVYYGGAAGAIPFRWESRPGTPKHTFSETSIPPLTPPPSYYSSASHSTSKASSKPTLLSSIFPRRTLSSFSASSSSSCSSPSPFVRPKFFKRRHRHSLDAQSLPLEYNFNDNDDNNNGEEAVGSSNSPTSTLGYGVCSGRGSFLGGCYQLVSVKNALLTIVGHGSTTRG